MTTNSWFLCPRRCIGVWHRGRPSGDHIWANDVYHRKCISRERILWHFTQRSTTQPTARSYRCCRYFSCQTWRCVKLSSTTENCLPSSSLIESVGICRKLLLQNITDCYNITILCLLKSQGKVHNTSSCLLRQRIDNYIHAYIYITNWIIILTIHIYTVKLYNIAYKHYLIFSYIPHAHLAKHIIVILLLQKTDNVSNIINMEPN